MYVCKCSEALPNGTRSPEKPPPSAADHRPNRTAQSSQPNPRREQNKQLAAHAPRTAPDAALMRSCPSNAILPLARISSSPPPLDLPARLPSRCLRLAAEARYARELLPLGQPRPPKVLVQVENHLERVAAAQIRQRRLRFCKPDPGLDVPAGTLANVRARHGERSANTLASAPHFTPTLPSTYR